MRGVTTRGYPGEQVLGALQGYVKDRPDKQQRAYFGGIEGWSMGEGGIEAQAKWEEGDAAGVVIPVHFNCLVPANGVGSVEVGPLPGPLWVEWCELATSLAIANAVDQWCVVRVDACLATGLQTVVFNTTGPPTGYVEEGQTLFRRNNYAGAGETTTGFIVGWRKVFGVASGGQVVSSVPVEVLITLQPIFLKCYFQNDSGTARVIAGSLSCRAYSTKGRGESGIAYSGVPQFVRPRWRHG